MKVLISGSSSGIGRAIAEKVLALGGHVVGLARDLQKFTPASRLYHPYRIDFATINQLENEFRAIQNDHPDIDALVCCAGYGEFKELEQFSVSAMQEMMNVNFLSQAVLVKSFLPMLKKLGSGRIVLLGSECALEGQKKGSVYCATKFALRGFAQSIRKECAKSNVGVTLINPGMVDTPFFKKLNFRPAAGDPHAILAEQIANLVRLILQEKNNLVYEEISLQPMKKVISKNSSYL